MTIPLLTIDLLGWFCRFLLAFMIVCGLTGLVELFVSHVRMRAYGRSLRFFDHKRFLESDYVLPVSIVVPIRADAPHAEDAIETLNNLLALDFPQHEVIAVVSGSSESALRRLSDAFLLLTIRQPYKRSLPAGEIGAIYRSAKDLRLIVATATDGQRANALNAGVNLASYPVVLTADPTVLFARDALMRIVYIFASDPLCMAVGGAARVACEEPMNWLERRALELLQRIERLRMLYPNHSGAERTGALLSVCDSFFAFRKSALLEAGGFRPQTAGEEGDLLLRMQRSMRRGKRQSIARFLTDPICSTAPLEETREILLERRRWQAALLERLSRFGRFAPDRPGKQTGAIGLPYFWFFDVLAPVLETIGYLAVPAAWLLGATGGWFVLIYFLLGILMNAALSAGSVLLEEHAFQGEPQAGMLLWLFAYSFADGVWYRPLTRAYRLFSTRRAPANKTRTIKTGRAYRNG